MRRMLCNAVHSTYHVRACNHAQYNDMKGAAHRRRSEGEIN
jgi:hypothetical protein